MILNQKYSFTGSIDYYFNNIGVPKNGIALFDSQTGIGGINYMPADGDTVTVVAGYNDPLINGEIKKFLENFGNKIYYLVSDIQYTSNDRDEIISLATEISLTYNPSLGGYYEGTFVFSNPNSLKYLYLIYDYSDNLNEGSISYTGSFSERIVDVNFGTNIGIPKIDYETTNKPVRYQLYWNNYLIEDTGYIGLNSTANYNGLISLGVNPDDIKLSTPLNGLVNNGDGTISFNKFTQLPNAILVLSAPMSGTSFTVSQSEEDYLSEFWINPTASTLSSVCSLIPNIKYFHDGLNVLPTIGDKIYTVSTGLSFLDGGNSYFHISSLEPPSTSAQWIVVDSNGVVINEGSCLCDEISEPVITSQSFVFINGQDVDIQLTATNNPLSWEVITPCESYTLTGGTTGTIFTIEDCKYGTQTVTLNINEERIVCSSSNPSIVGGDGTVTLIGACTSFVLPIGLSFDTETGRLIGSLNDEGDFSFDVEATNCFGTSDTETIYISVVSNSKFKPFLIDIENFTDVCSLTSPLYSVLYHNGSGDVPTVGDLVVRTYNAEGSATPFYGGEMWYAVYNSPLVIKICNSGKVCDENACAEA